MATGVTKSSKYKQPFQLKDDSLFVEDSYIDGSWVQAESGKRFEIVDPGTDEPWASSPDNDAGDVESAVQSSYKAFQDFKKLNPRKRSQLLLKWHELIVSAKDDLATLLTYETGKPISESHGELDMALGFAWWFAGEADRVQGTVFSPSTPNRRTFTIKQPLGVVAALVPWNYPVAMILRKLAAAFAAGCTVVVKPSPETPLTCLTLAKLASQAGFAPGVFNVLTTSNENTAALSQTLILHPLVKKVTFTGSTKIGKIIAGLCAQNLKKCSLELGGNSPYIIFEDADLGQAVGTLMLLKWKHAGQSCISANRVYVHATVYDKVVRLLVEQTRSLKTGHASNNSSTMGPVTTKRSLSRLEDLTTDAIAKGAKLALGNGKMRKAETGKGSTGYFMEPTILTDLNQSMNISREEIFGPVAALYKFQSEGQVVALANETSMGLASYAFTKNVDRIWRLYENLEAGIIGLNTGSSTAAEVPFGGIKESGYGKEGGKDVGIDEYMYTKTGTLTIDGQY